MADTDHTAQLAAFASSEPAFPADVAHEAKRMLLDQFACQIACAPLPWSENYRAAVQSLGSGAGATSVYFGDALAVDDAAFLNGAFGHGNEFDDSHVRSTTHLGAVIVPAVLAMAENRHVSGRTLLDGLVAGSEVMIRVTVAASPHLHDRGHHTPPAAGPFGAAAGCSRVLGLDPVQTENALAISGSHAGGLLEYNRSGGSVKRIHCGIPAMWGVRSTLMAQHGITGPTHVLEGERGFLAVFAGKYDAELLTGKLADHYYFREMSYKPMACNFSTHAPLQALGELREEYGLTLDNVAEITVGTSRHTIDHVGNIVEPPDILGAQFSLRFGCAVRIINGGNGFYDYHDEDLRDPRFVGLAKRVKLEVDEICNTERLTLNNRSGVVTVKTTDGRTVQRRVQYSKGLYENPLSDGELTQKFFDAVIPRVGEEAAKRLAERVWTVDDLADAADLLPMTFPRSAVPA